MTQIEKVQAIERDFTVTAYPCPVCHQKMFTEPDLSGCTVWCGAINPPRKDGYHCKEVHGHGKDSKAAYQVIKEKFTKALEDFDESLFV